MKQCRHCGVENEDGLTVCIECGLDMSPSAASRVIAKLPSVISAAERGWLRHILVALAVLFGTFAIYLLSLGPILRFYGVRPSSGWNRLPFVVRAIYEPLDSMPVPEPIARMLRGYNGWWMRASSEKADYVRLMRQIDESIPIGTLQSNVIRMLGQPIFWGETTEGNLVAAYFLPPPTADFDILTNGFRITFSNGIVVGKTPNTVMK